jgi:CHAD domain-containing protein
LISDSYPALLTIPDFQKFLKRSEKKAIKKFKRSVKAGKKAYLETLEIISKYAVLSENDFAEPVDKLIDHRLKEIKETASKNINDDDFHRLRIQLKEINHIILVRNDERNRDLLDQLTEIAGYLGIWHDHIILSEYIKEFLLVKKIVSEDPVISNSLSDISGFCEDEKLQIQNGLKHSLSNV